MSPSELAAIEDRHVLRVLERQRAIGMKIFTDGELRRDGFMGPFYDSVEGLGEGSIQRRWQSRETAGRVGGTGLRGIVTDRVRAKKRMTSDEVGFLKRHSPGDVKITLPTANQFPAIAYKKEISEKAYPSYSDFLWDIVPFFRSEISSLAAEGVKYIQIDAPRYSYYIDPKWRRYVQEEMGVDPETALDEAIRVDNASIAGATREDVIVAIHLCRGNHRSQWYAEGGYDPIAEKLFNQLDVDVFCLEYDSERAGNFEPLRFVPEDKVVVLGLISSKLPELESTELLARRIEDASRYVPLDNLALSPQCGFASSKEGNLLTEDQQWAKLERVVETARVVWSDT